MDLDKVDLVMWTKNGERPLPAVLKRIGEVIPAEAVNQRLIVDDHSSDRTREIAGSFGWQVIYNRGKGISDGANTALSHVETEFFVSFEQDLLLAWNWWNKIRGYLSEPEVAVASGVRFVYSPLALKRIEEYTAESYMAEEERGNFVPYVKTLDNTIYKTQIIREVGGFPMVPSSIAVDQALSQLIHSKGLKWKVDYTLHSVHLRNGLKDEFAHTNWYGTHSDEVDILLQRKIPTTRSLLMRLMVSPVRGFQIALKKRAPEAFCVYPLLRWHYVKGVVEGRRGKAIVLLGSG